MTVTDRTAAERLITLLAQQGVTGRFNPASTSDLAEANAVAPLPEPMTTLYLTVDMIRFGSLEPFHIMDFVEVNEVREGFGEVSEGIFVASDLAEGWFFVDPTGFMGLRPGFVFWVERGRFDADDCVPAGETLIDLFETAAAGETPWRAPMLGDRAVSRLITRLNASSAVATRPPIDPARFRAPGQSPVPLRLARILEASDGFLLHISDREFYGLAAILPVPGTGEIDGLAGALRIGRGPGGQLYAATTGIGWRRLPADRMIIIESDVSPENAPVLGRTADVWDRWIREDEEK